MKRDISTRTNPSRMWKEAIAEEGLHSRLVRLHRPFMAKHAYSRSSCLESAEKLIRSHVVITAATKNVRPPLPSSASPRQAEADLAPSPCRSTSSTRTASPPRSASSSTSSSASRSHSSLPPPPRSLLTRLALPRRSVDQDLAEPEVEKKKEVLLIATEIFSRADEISSPSLRQIVVMGSKILGGLFAALEKRRVARAASALVPGAKKSDTPPESFAVVLQRLTQELDLAGNPAAPHLSPAPPDKPALVSSSAPPPPALYGNNGAYLVPPSVGGASLSAPALAGAPSVYAPEQPFGPGGSLPYDLNVVDVNSDAFLSGDFFRDVGLTAPNGALASFDFLQGTATPAPLRQQPTTAPPYGSIEGYFGGGGGMGGPALGWDFGASGATGGGFAPGEGGGQGGRMAATALMDQLTTGGGVW